MFLGSKQAGPTAECLDGTGVARATVETSEGALAMGRACALKL